MICTDRSENSQISFKQRCRLIVIDDTSFTVQSSRFQAWGSGFYPRILTFFAFIIPFNFLYFPATPDPRPFSSTDDTRVYALYVRRRARNLSERLSLKFDLEEIHVYLCCTASRVEKNSNPCESSTDNARRVDLRIEIGLQFSDPHGKILHTYCRWEIVFNEIITVRWNPEFSPQLIRISLHIFRNDLQVRI